MLTQYRLESHFEESNTTMAKKRQKKSGPHPTPQQLKLGLMMGMNLQQIKRAISSTGGLDGDMLGNHSNRQPPKSNYDIANPSLLDESKEGRQYTLTISLSGSPVRIFRQIEVPSNMRLEHLGKIILRAMGWEDFEHLHQFTKGGINYMYPCDNGGFSMRMKDEDAMAVTVSEVLTKINESINFEYDFGDSWMHEVKLTQIDQATSSEQAVRVLYGAGACPPEDCGGVLGYREILGRLKRYGRVLDEDDEDYDDMLDGWLEPGFDPEAFNVKQAEGRVQNYINQVNR